MKADQLISSHVFVFNKNDNGGESVSLHTKFIANGDNGPGSYFLNQEFSLQSYCNSAHFELIGCSITPSDLHQLAFELENKMKEVDYVLSKDSRDSKQDLKASIEKKLTKEELKIVKFILPTVEEIY